MNTGRLTGAPVAFGAAGYCGVRVPQSLYLYRRSGQNRTLENTKPKWQKYFRKSMGEIYPELYNGERPMACCGRGKTAQQNLNRGQNYVNNNQLLANRVASDGMVYVQYVGSRVASFNIWGSNTPTRYRVDPKAPIFQVHQADLATNANRLGILDITEGANKYAFELYEPPVQERTEEATVETVIEVESIEPAVLSSVYPEAVEEVSELSDLSILQNLASLDSFLRNESYTPETLERLLAYETSESGRNRVGAIDRLTNAIDTYDGTHAV